jgi:ATP-dependent Lhr-like helicase
MPLARELDDHTRVLYVSPLKALSNDVQKNLQKPPAEIGQAVLQAGLLMPGLRVLVRTGDRPIDLAFLHGSRSSVRG